MRLIRVINYKYYIVHQHIYDGASGKYTVYPNFYSDTFFSEKVSANAHACHGQVQNKLGMSSQKQTIWHLTIQ